MKAILILALLGLLAPLGAQEEPVNPQQIHETLRQALSGFLPPEFIIHHREKINLSDEQVTKIRGHAQIAHGEFERRHHVLGKHALAFQKLLQTNPIDEEAALQALDAVLEAENAVKRLHVRLNIRVHSILTPEQRKLAATLHRQRVSPDGQGGARNSHGEEPTERPEEQNPLTRRLHQKLRQLHSALAEHPNAPAVAQTRQSLPRIHENLAKGNPALAEKLIDEALKKLKDSS